MKNKWIFWVIIVAEIIFLFTTTMKLAKSREDILISADDLMYSSYGEEIEPSTYLDASYDGESKSLLSPVFTLNRGVYNVRIEYQSNNTRRNENIGCWSKVIPIDIPVGYINSGIAKLVDDVDTINYHVYVYGDNVTARIENGIDDEGDYYILITGLSISYCRFESAAHGAIVLLAIFAVIDLILILCLFYRERAGRYIKDNAEVIIVMSTATLIALFPILRDSIGYGDDLGFHMQRIYQIAHSLKMGYFPVYVMPDWKNGYGYASGIFYGDTLLFVPALLYIAGFSLAASYRFLVISVNILTAFIAYFSFKKIGNSQRAGEIAASAYVLCVYRVIDIYQRADVGEWTAISFFPLLILGLWEVYHENETQKSWIYLVLGACGLASTHVLSSIISVFLIVVFMLICIKKTVKKDVYLTLLKAVGIAVLANLYFIVPFLDSFAHNKLREVIFSPLNETSIYLVQMFSDHFSDFNNSVTNGMYRELPITMGPACLLIVLFSLYLWLKEDDKEKKRGMGVTIAIFGIIVFMASNFFPYAWIYKNIPSMEPVLRNLQFSFRFMSVGPVLACTLLTLIFRYNEGSGRKTIRTVAICLAAFACFSASRYVFEYSSMQPTEERVYDHDEGDAYWEKSSGEYTLYNLTPDLSKDPVVSDETVVMVSDYSKKALSVTANVANTSGAEQYIDLPLQGYYGYKVSGDNAGLYIVTSDEGKLRVMIPAGYSGSMNVRFAPPVYWNLSFIISLVTIIGIICYINKPESMSLVFNRKKNG